MGHGLGCLAAEGQRQDRPSAPTMSQPRVMHDRYPRPHQSEWRRMRYSIAALAAWLCLSATPILAQPRSPVQDLLANARGALNDLRYADVDSITQVVLAYPQLRRGDRIQALQIAAGALFPEQSITRQRERAAAMLGQLIRIAPTAGLPREITWAGLDELNREVLQQTFGASVTVREKNVITGPSEALEIDVVASRPTVFYLTATRAGGSPVLLDSITGAQRGRLRVRMLVEDRPRFQSGSYELVVTAIDPSRPDTILHRYDAVMDAPSLEMVSVPNRFDTATLLPELTRPKRALGVVGGVLVAAGTIIASSVLREAELKDAQKRDGRAVPLGIVLGGITAGGVWLLDKGAPLPKNVAANRATKEAFDKSVIAARTINEERVRTYQAQVTINPEAR